MLMSLAEHCLESISKRLDELTMIETEDQMRASYAWPALASTAGLHHLIARLRMAFSTIKVRRTRETRESSGISIADTRPCALRAEWVSLR